jgi:hypothetical protein
MYRALKSAQVDINAALLKLVDDVLETKGSPEPCCGSNPDPQCAEKIQMLSTKTDAQFRILGNFIQSLNDNMAYIIELLNNRTVPVQATPVQATPAAPQNVVVQMPAVTTIPSIQETATTVELRDMCEGDAESAIDVEDDIVPSPIEVEVEEVEVEVEEVEVEVEEEVEVEVEEEVEVEVEEDLEVEEWTYKGRMFFKDSNNTVYANDNGDVGDPIGNYDPVKNLLKKLPPS